MTLLKACGSSTAALRSWKSFLWGLTIHMPPLAPVLDPEVNRRSRSHPKRWSKFLTGVMSRSKRATRSYLIIRKAFSLKNSYSRRRFYESKRRGKDLTKLRS